MDSASPGFNNFSDIFNNIVIPSVYLLERNNTQHHTIKEDDFTETYVI